MIHPTPLMLDKYGKVLRAGDIVLVLGVFPATVKDFAVHDAELGAVVRRPSRQDSFVYFEEIERLTFRAGKVASNEAQENNCAMRTFPPNNRKESHETKNNNRSERAPRANSVGSLASGSRGCSCLQPAESVRG
ncbi:MAG: hypothetical protein ABSG01_13515 [Anaerolineales bacterium]